MSITDVRKGEKRSDYAFRKSTLTFNKKGFRFSLNYDREKDLIGEIREALKDGYNKALEFLDKEQATAVQNGMPVTKEEMEKVQNASNAIFQDTAKAMGIIPPTSGQPAANPAAASPVESKPNTDTSSSPLVSEADAKKFKEGMIELKDRLEKESKAMKEGFNNTKKDLQAAPPTPPAPGGSKKSEGKSFIEKFFKKM